MPNSKLPKWSFCIILLLLSSSNLYGQNRNDLEETVRKVADQIIQKTSFRFEDTKTGKLYSSTNDVPVSADLEVVSRSNKWAYVNGVLNVGMVQTGKVLGDEKYTHYSMHNYDFIFSNLTYFKKKYNSGDRAPYHAFFRMQHLDDCGAMGAAVIDVYKIEQKKPYRAYADKVANYITTGQDKLADGTLARDHPRNMTLWADDLYMSVPFLARYGDLTGDEKYFDFAIEQVESFNKHLYDPATGLLFHNWYSDVRMNGVAHWGRANGWAMMAQVELLKYLPKDHPKRDELIHLLLRQIVGASRYQDESGLWHQILDKPDSYLESSVTAMYIYSITKAVNERWIPRSYLSIAQEGWEGLLTNINRYGEVEDVCIGTNISDDINFYYNRPKELNDSHALGAVLLAGTELIKSTRNK